MTMKYSGSISTSDVIKYLHSVLNCRKYRSSIGTWAVRIKAKTTGNPAPTFTLYIDYFHYLTTYYELGTVNTNSPLGNDLSIEGLTCGIRVWKVNSDDTETEIDGSNLKATVTGPSAKTNLSNTYTNCVAIIVRIYRVNDIMEDILLGSGGFPFTFMTEDLNTTLSAI